MLEIVNLTNESWRVGLVPENGGSVAFGQVRINDEWVDVLRPTAENRLGEWWYAASYPLFPWSNRIRHGTLLWGTKAYQLRRWGTDDFSMHGTANEFPWQVTSQASDRVTIEFDSRGLSGVNFPWDFVARVEFVLDGPRFTWQLEIENADGEAFPAGFGHHPYFVRSLHSPDGSALGQEIQLKINCERGYALTNCMADGPAGPLDPVVDFRSSRSLGSVLVDTCLTGRTSPVVATLEYPGALTLDIEADDLLSHAVVYIPVGETYFAVEPVSNANDGFTLLSLGLPGSGVFVVDPGSTKSAGFTLVVR